MPGRLIPLVSGEHYHIFNRGISHQLTYTSKKDYDRFLAASKYYLYKETPVKLATFTSLPLEDREQMWKQIQTSSVQYAAVLAYCLMPNHFHIALRQYIDGGIAKFIGNVCNSYTRYFNIRHRRSGSLFQGKFKAVHIQTDEQLLHLVRYIHLNPYTGHVVKSIENCMAYPYSSLKLYTQNRYHDSTFIKIETILSHFNTIEALKAFTINQAEYQKKLGLIKYLTIE